jgi:hypothetical protein
VLPVASLWASLDYKSVANLPIRVSQILYVTILISENKRDTSFKESSLLGKDISYDKDHFVQHINIITIYN